MRFALFLLLSSLSATTIDVIGDWPVDHFNLHFNKTKALGIEVRTFCMSLSSYLEQAYHPGVDKIFFLGEFAPRDDLKKIPKDKLVLSVWEPYTGGPTSSYWKLFSMVYTHNDRWVNGKNYRKLYYPAIESPLEKITPFSERKLCTIMCRNWTEKRLEFLKFLHNHSTDFTFFGLCPKQYEGSPYYGGVIPGLHSGIEKAETLSRYRFYLCFENVSELGYISEKIFNCFTAGCIPIYLGAPNVTDYIPSDCFIDYRNFRSNRQLYRFLESMTEQEFNGYLERIRVFLESPKAHYFTKDHFDEMILELATK